MTTQQDIFTPPPLLRTIDNASWKYIYDALVEKRRCSSSSSSSIKSISLSEIKSSKFRWDFIILFDEKDNNYYAITRDNEKNKEYTTRYPFNLK